MPNLLQATQNDLVSPWFNAQKRSKWLQSELPRNYLSKRLHLSWLFQVFDDKRTCYNIIEPSFSWQHWYHFPHSGPRRGTISLGRNRQRSTKPSVSSSAALTKKHGNFTRSLGNIWAVLLPKYPSFSTFG